MRTSIHRTGTETAKLLIAALCALYASTVQPASAQSPEKLDALAKVNEARRANGVPPLMWNAQLDKAAQRHSDDMASKGFVDEVGSDGTTSRQRIDTAGYARWQNVRAWSESIYAGQTNFDEAIAFFLSDEAQRRALLNSKFREIGIGIGKDNLRTYWTVTLGSQPNLLPIFINEGAAVTNDRQVAVQITQEEAVPNGEGNAIGRVVEIRISDKPDFTGAAWQPWETLVPFTLDRSTGAKMIYVQMRDGAGRTTIASGNIEYDPNSRGSVRPVGPGAVEAVETPVTASTPFTQPITTTALAVATAGASLVATQVATTLPTVAPPTATSIAINPVVTLAPEPTQTAQATQASSAPAPTPAPAAVVVMVQPTFTPAPSSSQTQSQPQTVMISLTPDNEMGVRQFGGSQFELPAWLVPLYLIAQAAVIVFGLAAFIRRK